MPHRVIRGDRSTKHAPHPTILARLAPSEYVHILLFYFLASSASFLTRVNKFAQTFYSPVICLLEQDVGSQLDVALSCL